MHKRFSISKFFYCLCIKNWYFLGLSIALCVFGFWISLFMILGIILFIINLIIALIYSISIEQSIMDNPIDIQNDFVNVANENQNEEDFMQTIYQRCENKIKMLDENTFDNLNQVLVEKHLSIMARYLKEEVNKEMSLDKIGSIFINECMPYKDERDSFTVIVNTIDNILIIFNFRFETYSEINDLKLIVSYQNDINEIKDNFDKKIEINNEKELEEFLCSEILIKQIIEKNIKISEIKIKEEVVLKK